MPLERLALVGTGLIGASVGLAAKRAGVRQVVGWDAVPRFSYAGAAPLLENLAKAIRNAKKVS